MGYKTQRDRLPSGEFWISALHRPEISLDQTKSFLFHQISNTVRHEKNQVYGIQAKFEGKDLEHISYAPKALVSILNAMWH